MKSYIIPEKLYGPLTKAFGMQVFHTKEKTGNYIIKPVSNKVFEQMEAAVGKENFQEADECFKCHKHYAIEADPTLCPHCLTSL